MEIILAKKKCRLRLHVLVVLFFIMCFVPEVIFGRFVVEKNNIQVISPDSIANKYDSAIGNFGAPDYGGSMVLDVKVPDHASDGCTAFGSPIFKRTNSKSNPKAALLDRGGCFFAMKVWNAQNAGAAAVLIADNQDEPLITMDSPEQDDAAEYVDQISIPSAFIQKKLGDTIKSELSKKTVTVRLDWSESLPHPDDKVEYEFWTSSNDECGFKCETQVEFVKNFKGAAQLLEKGGYTTFTPHYITWYCPDEFTKSSQCQSECINHGRYCAPDPEQDFSKGYDGKDVVKENLRQLCVFQAANESGKPWMWWDYVTDMHIRCPFKNQKYSQDCAEGVVRSLGISIDEIRTCMGDPDSDSDHPILKAEQDAQVGTGNRGDVTILPTLVINDGQYRGKLDKGPVLKAICSGFRESTEPSVCLSQDIQTNECLTNNGGCWKNDEANITACKDTFRGRMCECPVVDGVQFQGDGYTYCEAVGPGRCKINNGGCWTQTKDGQTFSACQTSHLKGCDCPPGFHGDGKYCEDIDECKEKTACQCADCSCKNKWGGYDCTCKNGLFYMSDQDACIGKVSQTSVWMVISLLFISMVGTGVAGYVLYRHRMRAYMDTEIRAIMSQYMSLEDDNDLHQPLHR